MRVLKASSPCNCTIADLGDSLFHSAQPETITVKYKTGMAEGPFEQQFILETDSKVTPTVTLTIKGTVTRHLLVYPGSVVLDGAQVGGGFEQEAKVVWRRYEPPGFGKVDCPSFLTCSGLERQKADTTEWRMTVGLAPRAGPGHYRDTIRIATGSESWPMVEIPVRGEVLCLPITSSANDLSVSGTTPASDPRGVTLAFGSTGSTRLAR